MPIKLIYWCTWLQWDLGHLQRPVARACFNDHHPFSHAFLEDARRCLECTRKAPVQFPLCLLLLHRNRIEQELLYFYKCVYVYMYVPRVYVNSSLYTQRTFELSKIFGRIFLWNNIKCIMVENVKHRTKYNMYKSIFRTNI